MDTNSLTLYQYASCPFCQKVLRFMAANNIDLPLKDTMMDPDARHELIELGGRGMVPALRIGDEIMYESDDIIQWLQENVEVAA